MQAYASAQLTPLESESLDTPVPSIKPASPIEVGGTAAAQLNSGASPIAALTSLILDGLSDRDLSVLARRLLPHLRQPADDDRLARAAYTVASLAAELGISQKAIRCAIARSELVAVKRGARWLISADAVREWVTPAEQHTQRRGRAARCRAQGGGPVAPLSSVRRLFRSQAMSVEKIQRSGGEVVWRVRWRQHGRNRARTFSMRRDAADFDAEVRRQRRAGGLAALDAGTESLGDYVTGTWAATHAVTLAPKTRLHYASLYDHHLRPFLGAIALRDIDAETIGRWQSDRLAAGSGPIAVRQAMDLLGSVLEHAFVSGRIPENPVRRVKKARLSRREEVRALSPATVEAMRAALGVRDATLLSVLAYAGLRPGEALGLRWGDIRDRTILVQRSVSLGEEADTKTRQHRTVRLLAASSLRTCAPGAWLPADPATASLSFLARMACRGHRRPISLGAGGRSVVPQKRLGSSALVRMTCVTASRRSCCTKAGA